MKLSEKAWSHIRSRHPEMSRYKDLIENVESFAELILRCRRGEFKAVRLVKGTHLDQKHLVVVYTEREEKARLY